MSHSLYPVKKLGHPLEFVPGRKWLHENVTGKKDLLICIGDSWTWGDLLGTTTMDSNDEKARYDQFYTNRLAEKLNSDWLMIAWCGQSNYWIINQYKIVNQAIKDGYYHRYDNVFVHVCLTELFRELSDMQVSYLIKKTNKARNFKDFCNNFFQSTVLDRLEKLSPLPGTHLFSKNFWDVDVDCTHYNFVDDAWQQVLFEETSITDNEILPVISSIGIDPLIRFLQDNKLQDLKYEFSDLLVKINQRIDNMTDCPLNNKESTRHPTAEGHQLWADYLYSYYSDL